MCRPPIVESSKVASLDARVSAQVYEMHKRLPMVGRLAIGLCSLFGDEVLAFPVPLVAAVVARPLVGIMCEIFGDMGLLSFVEQATKLVARRRRPAYANQSSFYVLPGEQFSLPSGHSLRAFYLAASLSLSASWQAAFGTELRVAAWIFAAGTAVARVMKGRHYVGDVLVGALLGVAIALFAATLGPRAWATFKLPCGIAMCLEAIAVVTVPRWRQQGFYVHVIIAACWCVSTRFGLLRG